MDGAVGDGVGVVCVRVGDRPYAPTVSKSI